MAPPQPAGHHAGAASTSASRPPSPLPRAVVQITHEESCFKHDKRVGDYWLGRRLGEGAFAKVKEALHRPTGEKVALKIIDKKKARADKYVSLNLRREAKLMTMLCHPNILRLLDEVETANSYYLVTEVAEGGDLMNHIYAHEFLPEDEVRGYIKQIVSAVDHIHKAGIIHRDLKIENLLLDADHNIKIIDFGLSNTVRPLSLAARKENHCKTQCGSPAYAAPELLGREQYGIEVDIWSIGVNLFAMLTGSLPFTVNPFNITELHAKMLSRRMTAIPDKVTISEQCHDLLNKLLEPSRADRIKMPEIFKHPWLNNEAECPFEPVPYPNTPPAESLDGGILHHMTTKMGMAVATITESVVGNKASPSSVVYHLLSRRLTRYYKDHPEAAVRRRPRQQHQAVKQQHRRSAISTNSGDQTDMVPVINEDEPLETVQLPSGMTNGWQGITMDERLLDRGQPDPSRPIQLQRGRPWSGDEGSGGSNNASGITSPIHDPSTRAGPFSPTPMQDPTARSGPFSPMSDEDDRHRPLQRAESFSVKTRAVKVREPMARHASFNSSRPKASTVVRHRQASGTSSIASPRTPGTPDGPHHPGGAPSPTDLKRGVEKAFSPASISSSRHASTEKMHGTSSNSKSGSWLPPAIDAPGTTMTSVASKKPSSTRIQELHTSDQPPPARRVLPSSFGKAVNDVRTNQASNRSNWGSTRPDDLPLHHPPRLVKKNTFFQGTPDKLTQGDAHNKPTTRSTRRNSFVEELGTHQPHSVLPAINTRGSISAGKHHAGKQMSQASVGSRPHTTGTAASPAPAGGSAMAKSYIIDSLAGVAKYRVVHLIVTTLNAFHDIENVMVNGMSVRCTWFDVVVDVQIVEDGSDTCTLKFEVVDGQISRLRLNEISDQIVKALNIVA